MTSLTEIQLPSFLPSFLCLTSAYYVHISFGGVPLLTRGGWLVNRCAWLYNFCPGGFSFSLSCCMHRRRPRALTTPLFFQHCTPCPGPKSESLPNESLHEAGGRDGQYLHWLRAGGPLLFLHEQITKSKGGGTRRVQFGNATMRYLLLLPSLSPTCVYLCVLR